MLEKLEEEYRRMQDKYGDSSLDSITFGGCFNAPDLCFVFMNPTGRNIASSKEWKGLKSPWIGTKNIWSMFYELGIIRDETYQKIRSIRGKDWTEEFSSEVYDDVRNSRVYITNLAKCTQLDARALKDEVFFQYLDLFFQEMDLVRPKKIILFGNQVSSIVLHQKISVSAVRRKEFLFKGMRFYSVYYPVGNGFFNVDKAIEDIKYIRNQP